MDKSFLQLLKENWMVIVVIAQFILTFGVLQVKVQDHDKRIVALESTKISDALNISEINSRLASIETSLLFITKALK